MAVQIKNNYLCKDLNYNFPSHMNFGQAFLDNILEHGNKTALVDGNTNEQLTFKEFAHQIMRISISLTRLGIKRGDVVAICSENRIEFIPTFIGILCAGGVATFFNSAYYKDDIVHIAHLSKPKLVFLSPSAYELHYATLKNINTIKHFYVYGASTKKPEARSFSELNNDSVNIQNFSSYNFNGENNRAMILYSSGTTGLPKGVNIIHKNLLATIVHDPFGPKPLSILIVSPLSNTMGLMAATNKLVMGRTVILLVKFVEEMYLKVIERYKVQMLLAAPPLLVILSKSSIAHNYDTTSVELIACGGAPLDSETMVEFKNRFPNIQNVLQGYGMTESAGAVSKESPNASKHGSVGKIMPGLTVKIVDPTSGQILGPNQPGELCIKGPIVFDSYIGAKRDVDDEGFYKTGDIAYFDEDAFIFIVDRIKELIKYKAWQVAPSELEGLLLQHPSVLDAGVVGIPDKLSGELPTAFVVKKPKAAVTEQEIIEYIAAKVSPWKKLRGGVRFVDTIPKNPSGKILRRALRDSLVPKSKL